MTTTAAIAKSTPQRWAIDSPTAGRQIVFRASDARRITRAWTKAGFRVTVTHFAASY